MSGRRRAGSLTLGTRVRLAPGAGAGVITGLVGVPLSTDVDVHMVFRDGHDLSVTVPASLLVEVLS